jgi:hypothetical protein
MLEGLILGAHLMSYHDTGDYNNVNPGVYLQHQSGATVGSYYNSERRQSYYGGYTFKPFDSLPHLDSTVGVVSGYGKKRVMPFVLPSYTVYESGEGVRARVGYWPKVGTVQPANVFHLMMEKKF